MSFPRYDFRLLLLRHGEAVSNVKGAFLGRRDDPLTARGQAQAADLAARLSDFHIDAVHASPLRRASATAAVVAARMNKPVHTSDALLEQDFGDWDGLTFGEVKGRFPDDFRAWRESGDVHAPTGGEPLRHVADRIFGYYQKVRTDLPVGSTAAFVAHGGVSQALLCRLLNVPLSSYWPFRLQTGTYTEVQFTADHASLVGLGL